MNAVEIVIVVLVAGFLIAMVIRAIVRKKKGISGSCDCGQGKGKALVNAFHKQKAKEAKEESCCCCCCKDKKTNS